MLQQRSRADRVILSAYTGLGRLVRGQAWSDAFTLVSRRVRDHDAEAAPSSAKSKVANVLYGWIGSILTNTSSKKLGNAPKRAVSPNRRHVSRNEDRMTDIS